MAEPVLMAQPAAALATYHVYFDGRPEVRLHLCDGHRAVGQRLCTDGKRPNGDCSHVQTRRCDCRRPPRWDGCVQD